MRKYLVPTGLALASAGVTVLVGLYTLPGMARVQPKQIEVGADSKKRCTLQYQFTELFSWLPAQELPATPFPNRVALAKYISENEADLGNLAEAIYEAMHTKFEATKTCFRTLAPDERYQQSFLFKVSASRDRATISRGRFIDRPAETLPSRKPKPSKPATRSDLPELVARCFDEHLPAGEVTLTAAPGKTFPVYDSHIPWRISFLPEPPAEPDTGATSLQSN
jgi:hypothetical protein